VLVLTLFPNNTNSMKVRKAVCSIVIALLNILLQMYASPYESINLDRMKSLALGAEFFCLFSGLIFLSDKMSPSFRTALIVANVIVILFALIALGVFIMLDIAPQNIQKLKTFMKDREARKASAERKKLRNKREKELKKQGLKLEDQPLSIIAQMKIMRFVRNALVTRQGYRFLNARAVSSLASIRTAWGQDKLQQRGAPRGARTRPSPRGSLRRRT